MTANNSKLFLIMLSFISAILVTVLSLGFYSIQAKNKETSQLLNVVDNATEESILTRSIRAIRNNADKDLVAFDKFVFSGDKLVPLIEKIEEAGRALGLDTNILSVGKIEDKKSLEPNIVRITMETQGPWAPTLSFLRAMESLPYRVMIDESSFTREETVWRLKITLALYSFD